MQWCTGLAIDRHADRHEIQQQTEFMASDPNVKKKFRPSRFQVIAARDLLNKMTQEQLSKASGVNRDTLGLFEAGQTQPHDSTIGKLQKALEDRGIVFTNGEKPGVILDRSKAIIPA